jgi:hypothetical protein
VNIGDAVGPAVLTEHIGAIGDVHRFRGTSGGETVEVLVASPSASRGVRAAFEATHAALQHASHPGVLTTTWSGPVDGGTFAAIRPWTDPLPIGRDATLAEQQLRALVPAVLSAGTALQSSTNSRDLRQRSDGSIVVAPIGADTATDMTTIAPEKHSGTAPSPESALYGLGAVFYTALTGRTPLDPGLKTDDGTPELATTWRTDLPFNLTQALAALLATSPSERRNVTVRLDTAAPKATTVVGTVKLTTRADRDNAPIQTSDNARLDVVRDSARALIAVENNDLQRLTPTDLSVLAGWSNRTVSHVRDVMQAGSPLIVEGFATAQTATARIQELERTAAVPLTVLTPPSALGILASLGASGLGLLVIGLALVSGVYWMALLSVLFFAATVLGLAVWGAQALSFRLTAGALSEGPKLSLRLQSSQKRIAAIRRHLPVIDLPVAADSDVRDALTELERRLMDLAAVDTGTGPGQSTLDDEVSGLNRVIEGLESSLPARSGLPMEPVLAAVHAATIAARDAVKDASL